VSNGWIWSSNNNWFAAGFSAATEGTTSKQVSRTAAVKHEINSPLVVVKADRKWWRLEFMPGTVAIKKTG
jgi:hypothetical protein